MNLLTDLLAFAGVMALGQFSPGPDMLLLTRVSLARGARQGVCLALGVATGLAVHGALAVAGVAVALESVPWLRRSFQWGAALYLGWLSWKLLVAGWQGRKGGGREERLDVSQQGNPFLQGLFCNLLNPKVLVFLAAVVSPFLKGAPTPGWPWMLWLVIWLEGGLLWSLWAVLLQWRPLREGYRRFQFGIDGAFGVVLLVLAIGLAFSGARV